MDNIISGIFERYWSLWKKPYNIFGFRGTDFYNILYYRNIFSTIYKI